MTGMKMLVDQAEDDRASLASVNTPTGQAESEMISSVSFSRFSSFVTSTVVQSLSFSSLLYNKAINKLTPPSASMDTAVESLTFQSSSVDTAAETPLLQRRDFA